MFLESETVAQSIIGSEKLLFYIIIIDVVPEHVIQELDVDETS